MVLDESKIQEYIKWYNISKDTMPKLVPPLNEFEIRENVSSKDWLIIPLPFEEGKLQAVNRPSPHIDLTRREADKIRIGIRCNTIKSVDKMKIILEGHNLKEKIQLIYKMRKLDDRFLTQVISKQKTHNFAQSPYHKIICAIKSNTIDEVKINMIFNLIKEIRKRGIEEKNKYGYDFLPEAPVLDLVNVSLPLNKDDFCSALSMMGPIFEICLKLKTRFEKKRERKSVKKIKGRLMGYICHRCDMKFTLENKPMFCPNCGTFITKPYYCDEKNIK